MKLGNVLKQAREAKQISIQDVCDVIHLSPKQVGALESNMFSLLPGPMITRGFIRNYAKFLEIDDAPLLKNYREQVPEQGDASLIVDANVNAVMSEQEQQPWLMYILGSILILLFLVAWFYYMDHVPAPDGDNVDDVIVSEVEEGVRSVPVEIRPVTNAATIEQAAEPEVVAALPAIAPVTDASDANTTQDTADDVTAEQAASNNAMIDTVELLVMRFPEESWLNVRDQYGKVVFKQLMTPGSEKTLNLKKPFRLTIGNAINVKVQYEGLDVDLVPWTKHNVARLKVE